MKKAPNMGGKSGGVKRSAMGKKQSGFGSRTANNAGKNIGKCK